MYFLCRGRGFWFLKAFPPRRRQERQGRQVKKRDPPLYLPLLDCLYFWFPAYAGMTETGMFAAPAPWSPSRMRSSSLFADCIYGFPAFLLPLRGKSS